MNFPVQPPRASHFAAEYDALFYVITALTIFFTVSVGLSVLYFAIRYRAGRHADRSNAVDHSTKLEVAWSLPPLFLGLAIFAWGAKLFVEMNTPPKDAMEIFCVGKQWMWHFQHANGVRENNTIHLPVGRPVKITAISQDVLHALYLPDHRVQFHVVPGRYTQLWFIPTMTGKFRLFCNMYCGTEHSEMGGYVYVMEQQEFQEWLANEGEKPNPAVVTLAQQGEALFKKMRCDNCHGDQDTERAPTLKALYGRTVTLANGDKVVADDNYIRNSILDPYRQVVKGYEKIMPANYNFREEQVIQLIAYIRSLGILRESGTTQAQTGSILASTAEGSRRLQTNQTR